MAPPNKQNCFMVFVKHWRYNHPGLSLPDAVSRCGVIWEKMSALERLPFGECINRPKGALPKADKAQLKLDEREEHLKLTTERIVKQAKKSQDLEKTKFLFCAFNYFTKDPDRDVYVPAEFAACEYSLKEGIISVFSTLIDPGQLNLGLSRDALDHSQATHKLPLPPEAIGERNLAKLHGQMIRYLGMKQCHRPAIVFTTTEMRPIVQSCFRFLARHAKNDFLLNLLVVDIQYLFFVLKREILDMVGLPNDKINIHITDAFFLKDFFEFTNDIACEFHEENDRTKYCAQSMVTRWAFTFSDYMCGDVGITVEPGKHVPSTVKPNYRIHNASDTWSGTLGGASSVESFYSLPSLQGLRIDEVKKSRPLRTDISAIGSRCSSAALEEVKECDRQGGRGSRLNEEFPDDEISSPPAC